MTMDSDSSQPASDRDEARTLELLLEAARRANWDAQNGPRHLRSGRFFVSAAQDAHASSAPAHKDELATDD